MAIINSLEEAIKVIREALPPDLDVIPDASIEKEYGWVIFSNTKTYIQTGNPLEMAIGSGGTLIERETGRKIEFGSAYDRETNLKIYELGYFRFEDWDIIIKKVSDMPETVAYIEKLGLTYVIPEKAHGETWRIPKDYSRKHLKSLLKTLPLRLHIGNLYFLWETLESFKTQRMFEYSLVESAGALNPPPN